MAADAIVTLRLPIALARETLAALNFRQRAAGSGTLEYELCGQAIAIIKEAARAPELDGGKSFAPVEGSGY